MPPQQTFALSILPLADRKVYDEALETRIAIAHTSSGFVNNNRRKKITAAYIQLARQVWEKSPTTFATAFKEAEAGLIKTIERDMFGPNE